MSKIFMPQNLTQSLKILTLAIVLSIGVSYAYAAWTSPTAAPTGGNIEAPVNVGGGTQVKAGALTVNGLLTAVSNLVVGGNVGIGTPSPLSKLDTYVITNNDGAYIEGNIGGNVQSLLLSPDSSIGAFIAGCTKPDGTTAHSSDGCGRLILQGSNARGFQFQTSNVASGQQNWSTKVEIKNDGALQLGVNSLGTCSNSEAGSIKYSGSDLMGCVDSGGTYGWKSLTASGGGGGGGCAAGSWIRNVTGPYTVTAGVDIPSCVTTINIEIAGAGGGGGGGGSGCCENGSNNGDGGGGGSAGQVNTRTYVLNPSETFTVNLGQGGPGGSTQGVPPGGDGNTGTNGGGSSIYGTSMPIFSSGGGSAGPGGAAIANGVVGGNGASCAYGTGGLGSPGNNGTGGDGGSCAGGGGGGGGNTSTNKQGGYGGRGGDGYIKISW